MTTTDERDDFSGRELGKGSQRRDRLRDLILEGAEGAEIIVPGVETREILLKGPSLTSRGGPAKHVLRLGFLIVRAIEEINPYADPWLEKMSSHASMSFFMRASEQEVKRTEARQAYFALDDEELESATDTNIAVTALAQILRDDDSERAAHKTRSISATSVDAVRTLGTELADSGVESVTVDNEAPIEHKSILSLVEQLDRVAEVPPVVITVTGVLQGANSGGTGQFEIRTDEQVALDPVLGNRRRPGDTLKGTLTGPARREIREGSLWDRHVSAEIEVIRRQRGPGALRVEGIRLLHCEARFGDSAAAATSSDS